MDWTCLHWRMLRHSPSPPAHLSPAVHVALLDHRLRTILEGSLLPGVWEHGQVQHSPARGLPSPAPSQPRWSSTLLCSDPTCQPFLRAGTDTAQSEFYLGLYLWNSFIYLYNSSIIYLGWSLDGEVNPDLNPCEGQEPWVCPSTSRGQPMPYSHLKRKRRSTVSHPFRSLHNSSTHWMFVQMLIKDRGSKDGGTQAIQGTGLL